MAEKTALCNRALTMLGDTPIESLTDDSVRATLCRTHYQDAVDDLLIQNDWAFASRRMAAMAPLATAPAWEFSFAFQLPTDPLCLRVRVTSEDPGWNDPAWCWWPGFVSSAWRQEGTTLVANISTISIRYTARVLEGDWPPDFATAVVYELAARVAFGITQKATIADLYAKLAPGKLALAKAGDGQVGTPRRSVTTALTAVRY